MTTGAQLTRGGRGVIPRPLRTWHTGPGVELRAGAGIQADPTFRPVAEWLRATLAAASGWALPIGAPDVAPGPAATGIALRRDLRGRRALGEEGYRLHIDARGVTITAAGQAGAFYGAQTLRLLLPPTALRGAPVRDDPVWPVPGVHITDRPRFAWRGAHIDVARHFMPLPWLKRLVDLLALHKLNVLHLHLTDDQGWRVQIDRYPRLTEVGAWRRESMTGRAGGDRSDGAPHGGFYTKDDLRELVAYAAARHIAVMPEIDMPGHTAAAIAAYPELGNGIANPRVRTAWGISDDVLNVEESTVRFFTDVLDEVIDLFPSRYIHVGGDECPTTQWRASPRAQELMRRRGVSEERQLQGWFLHEMHEHLRGHGRTMVCWDEVLEGGVAAGAVIMAWRGEAEGVAAARAGYDVVMTPESSTYLDWAQSKDPAEPPARTGVTSLSDVYGYEPVPDELEPEHHSRVLGSQCQLWTEHVPTGTLAEYFYFPRACAFAETVWSSGDKDYRDFEHRLSGHLRRLDALSVNYRPLDGPTPGQSRTRRRP